MFFSKTKLTLTAILKPLILFSVKLPEEVRHGLFLFMVKKKRPRGFLHFLLLLSSALLLLTSVAPSLFAQSETDAHKLALLPVKNLNHQADQDYLAGIIGSIFEKDLSGVDGIELLERQDLENILQEQQLQLSGLVDDAQVRKAGRLSGAQTMVKASYVFLGTDVFVSLSLIDVETGKSRSFTGRGHDENSIHAISEEVVEHLTGKPVVLRGDYGKGSIIALKQQEPGRVKLYSYLIDARVYLDEKFAGYSTGDPRSPLIIEVSPGEHKLRTHLTGDFGVIKEPEILFSDWEERFFIAPGEEIVLEDPSRHFNDRLYDLQKLLSRSLRLSPDEERRKEAFHSLGFTDREGKEQMIEVDVFWERIDGPDPLCRATLSLRTNGEERLITREVREGQDTEFTEAFGKVRLDLDLSWRSSYYQELDYGFWRTDVYQGLHREER